MQISRRAVPALALFSVLVVAPLGAAQALQLLPTSENGHETNLFSIHNQFAAPPFGSNAALDDGLRIDPGSGGNGPWDGQTWTGDEASVAVLIHVDAGYSNSFGTYAGLGDGSDRDILFADQTGHGPLGPAYDAKRLFDSGSSGTVGFFLATSGGGDPTRWHSRSDLDSGTDFAHAAAYALAGTIRIETSLGSLELQNAILLGWEDLASRAGADADFNDLVLIVGDDTTLSEVPEAATALLLGLGLTGLALQRRA